jgi:transposase, IS30 family
MARHYRHLSAEERNQIHRGRLAGLSLRAMARDLDRPVSAVSREVARNTVGASYDALIAGITCRQRRRSREHKLRVEAALWHTVVQRLYWGWSPEQIAGRLRQRHPDDPSRRVSHETIYVALYALPRGELRKDLLA